MQEIDDDPVEFLRLVDLWKIAGILKHKQRRTAYASVQELADAKISLDKQKHPPYSLTP
jgi:hypothetical protein